MERGAERGAKEFACTEADLMAYGNLGIYYAEKLRGAAHLARWMFGAGEAEQKQAVSHLELALKAWRGVVAATESYYAEKLRGAAHLARWMFGAGEAEQKQAVSHLELALKAWRGVVAATENHY